MLSVQQAQTDLLHLLLSSVQLAKINFVSQTYLLQSNTDVATVWTTPRNGYRGIGGIIERPLPRRLTTAASGPIIDWAFCVHLLEHRQFNNAVSQGESPAVQGSGISVEQAYQMVLDEVHRFADEGLSTFVADDSPVQPADLMHAGTGDVVAVGYKLTFSLPKGKSDQTVRTGQVQVTLTSGHIALACAADAAAPIWYTTDGTFPSLGATINPSSTLYAAGPVAVTPGKVVRARAYATGKLGSAVTKSIIP